MKIRRILCTAMLAGLALASLPGPAGGATDNVARVVAQKLAPLLQQPVVVVENRAGATGTISIGNGPHKLPPEVVCGLFGVIREAKITVE